VIVDDEIDEEPVREANASARRSRKRRRWPMVAALVLVVAVLGLGGYFGYQWTQSQYYVGANGDELVVFRGVDADMGPVTLKKVAYTEHVRVSSLPAVQQDQIRTTIPVDSLKAGIDRLKTFGASATPTPSASPTPTPTRSNK